MTAATSRARNRSQGTVEFFAAEKVFLVDNAIFAAKNGPVPGRPVNGCPLLSFR